MKICVVETDVTPTQVSVTDRTVTYSRDGKQETVSFGHLVSTIPLHALYDLQERKSLEVEQALAGLTYMDIIFVYVFLNRRLSNDHWLYFPDPDVVFNRAVEFANWSPAMCPPGKTSVCFDITVFEKVYPSLLETSDAMAEWTKGTTLVPYLERLPESLHEPFMTRYRERLHAHFPASPTFYTFRRTLFAATR